MSKKELRSFLRKNVRAALPENITTQSLAAAARLRTLREYQDAVSVALYMHMPNELETTLIIRNAFEDNKKVFLPRIVPLAEQDLHSFDRQTTHLQMLQIPSAKAAFELKPQGKYGILEPTKGTNCLLVGGVDLIVVPAMGFTPECDRIGHGKGYYDSFFDEHATKLAKTPTLVGIALQEQIVPTIPLEPHDVKMDVVVTCANVFRATQRSL